VSQFFHVCRCFVGNTVTRQTSLLKSTARSQEVQFNISFATFFDLLCSIPDNIVLMLIFVINILLILLFCSFIRRLRVDIARPPSTSQAMLSESLNNSAKYVMSEIN